MDSYKTCMESYCQLWTVIRQLWTVTDSYKTGMDSYGQLLTVIDSYKTRSECNFAPNATNAREDRLQVVTDNDGHFLGPSASHR